MTGTTGELIGERLQVRPASIRSGSLRCGAVGLAQRRPHPCLFMRSHEDRFRRRIDLAALGIEQPQFLHVVEAADVGERRKVTEEM